MSTTKMPPEVCPPKLVKLEKARKLAESWVNNMSGSTTDELIEVEFEGRPSRLGLGAKVTRQSKLGPSTDPVERKLRAKLDDEKRTAKSIEESTSERDGRDDDDDDDEDLESKTNAFAKKRAVLLPSYLHAKKKQKKVCRADDNCGNPWSKGSLDIGPACTSNYVFGAVHANFRYWLMDKIGGNQVEAAAQKGNTYSWRLIFGKKKAA